MTRYLNKKMTAVALTAGLVLGGGGVAFAFFTSTGSGHGSAAVGTGASNIVFTTDGPATLYPGALGDTAQAFNVIATNGNNVGEYVGSVSVSLMTSGSGAGQVVTDEGGTPITGCLSSWFAISTSATLDHAVPANGAYTLTGGGEPTIQLVESGTDQTPCAGHSVGIQFGVPV